MVKIRIGFIKYINSIPFYHKFDSISLEEMLKSKFRNPAPCKAAANNNSSDNKTEGCGMQNEFEYEIIYDTPARLNEMISRGELDIAAVSSYQYLKNRDSLQMLNNISISAFEQVMSVLLVSKRSMSDLSNQTILVSEESASAASLLRILAEDFFDNVNVKYITGKIKAEDIDKTLNENKACAIMVIGDEALKYFERSKNIAAPNYEDSPEAFYPKDNNDIKIFDLCRQWNRLTSLPFVFAVMAAKKDFYFGNKNICDNLSAAVKSKIGFFNSNRDIFIDNACKISGVGEDTMKIYYQSLNYEFLPEHIMALEEFEKRLKKINLLSSAKKYE